MQTLPKPRPNTPIFSTDPRPAPERMAELLAEMTTGPGIRPTRLDGVKLMRADVPHPRTPTLYEPSIVVIAQGQKRGYLDGRSFTYDANRYLVLTVPLPFECRTSIAADGRPMLGVSIRVEPATLAELLMTSRHAGPPAADAAARAFYAAPVDARLGDAVVRLLECLSTPGDAAVLGPQIVREITYRVLCGPHGGSLRALAATTGRLSGLWRVLERMHTRFAEPIDVPALARGAAMSPSSFHEHFRAVTSTSPLRYLKSVRLHKARLLMACDGLGAAQAATRVGYESPSQFSREFRRFFGRPPVEEAALTRQMLGFDDDRRPA